MLPFLTEWLNGRGGRAPVWVALVGEENGAQCELLAVDHFGVVLATPGRPDRGIAFPWTAIFSVMPDRTA